MKLRINGEEKDFSEETLTITQLLALNDVKMPEMVSVEHNSNMCERENFDKTVVNDGDSVEFLYFMGGGA